MAFEPRNLAEATAAMVVARADQAYAAGDWAAAQTVYDHVAALHPAVVDRLAIGLAAGHCAIERADAAALAGWSRVHGPVTGSPRESALAHDIKIRAIDYCRAGEFLRASVLLRFIAPIDPSISVSYANDMLTRRSTCAAVLDAPDLTPPRFLTDYAIDALPVARLKERHRGKRVLSVRNYGATNTRYGSGENVRRGAETFGMTVQEVPNVPPPGFDGAGYLAALEQTIAAFGPDVIWWDQMFLSGLSAEPDYAEPVADLLERVRRKHGIKVVNYYSDVWYVVAYKPGGLYAQLGRAIDVINHCHPTVLALGTDAEKAAVFCCPAPAHIPEPTDAPGAIPRACFIGSIHDGAMPRVVWWAETARAGLPLDFIETIHHPGQELSDLDYINVLRRYQLSLTLSTRKSGAKIFTGRVFDVPLVGGVLLEEHSFDTRYFLQPGVHYVPFETLPDLADLIPEMLADAPRRAQMIEAARAFVARYYTGDYYWAGLLDKLFPA
jgi:hypothetical protein